MTIMFLCPGSPETKSGGTRKLFDLTAILQNNGFDAKIIYPMDLPTIKWTKEDIVVFPEVFGEALDAPLYRDRQDIFVPRGVRRISFCQNGYLLDQADGYKYIVDPDNHPYTRTPDLIAILTESQHTTDIITTRFPQLPVPIIRTHSSGNGRNGQDAGFEYGFWPRKKWVMSFEYKHESLNAQVFKDLPLPEGWELKSLTGLSDEEIQVAMRTGAIFAACNINEGMCAPCSESTISGCVNVCWPGGPTGQRHIGGPAEYINGRAVIAIQDDVEDLRARIIDTARDIDADQEKWAKRTREWSDWFQTEYSREEEIAETIAIFESFGCTRESQIAA